MTATASAPLVDTSLYLVVAKGSHKGSMIPVKGPQFLIGKHPACHMRPSSRSVSNHHCGLLQREGRTFLCDLNSATGTYLNERQVVGEVEVLDQDRLRIGPLEFVIRLANAPAPSSAEQSAPVHEEVLADAPVEEFVGAQEEVLDEEDLLSEDDETAPIPMDEDMVGLTTTPEENEPAAEAPPPPDPAPEVVAAAETPSHRARAILRRYGKHRRKD